MPPKQVLRIYDSSRSKRRIVVLDAGASGVQILDNGRKILLTYKLQHLTEII
jgi:hypothetical protein